METLILPGSELGLESEPLWEGKFCGLGLECLWLLWRGALVAKYKA